MKSAAIILAGGSGSRMRGTVKDKVLCDIFSRPVIEYSAKAFLESGKISALVFVCKDELQKNAIEKIIDPLKAIYNAEIFYAWGGAERQDSVLNGVSVLPQEYECVFIHDGARPLVGVENVIKLYEAAKESGASVLAHKVVDSIKILPKNYAAGSAETLENVDRSRLWAMETPQVFKRSIILAAYTYVKENSLVATDDVSAATLGGAKIAIVENLSPNPKITVPSDIALVEFLLSKNYE